ncbi:MAG: HrcA family transcriptional regulator, partial [Dehalococcoidia bacterium]
MPLTERKAQILRLIVSEYIGGATPVGSEAVARHSSLGLSPATVRNEMAALEAEGYITHPHTSAGRIPSDTGYRYYVEALMEEEELSAEQKRTMRHQFHQAARELQAWMQLSATVVARLVDNVALVAPPRAARTSLRWLDLVHIHDFLALLVMVLRE